MTAAFFLFFFVISKRVNCGFAGVRTFSVVVRRRLSSTIKISYLRARHLGLKVRTHQMNSTFQRYTCSFSSDCTAASLIFNFWEQLRPLRRFVGLSKLFGVGGPGELICWELDAAWPTIEEAYPVETKLGPGR